MYYTVQIISHFVCPTYPADGDMRSQHAGVAAAYACAQTRQVHELRHSTFIRPMHKEMSNIIAPLLVRQYFNIRI